MIELKRACRQVREVNLIPLIDIIFMMVLFFMVAGRIEPANPLAIHLPLLQIKGEMMVRQAEILISADADGKVAINQDIIPDEDFAVVIQAALLENSSRPIRLKADANLSASKLIWLMDAMDRAGAKYVSVVTQLKSQK